MNLKKGLSLPIALFCTFFLFSCDNQLLEMPVEMPETCEQIHRHGLEVVDPQTGNPVSFFDHIGNNSVEYINDYFAYLIRSESDQLGQSDVIYETEEGLVRENFFTEVAEEVYAGPFIGRRKDGGIYVLLSAKYPGEERNNFIVEQGENGQIGIPQKFSTLI